MPHEHDDEHEDLEKAAAIRKIRRLMEFWRIRPDELRGRVLAPAVPPPVAPALVRYRHPRTGESWDGQGSQPPWLRQALIREGYTVEELRAASAPPTETAPVPDAAAPAGAPGGQGAG